MKLHYALGLLLVLASCKGSEVAATKEPASPDHAVRHTPDTGTPPAPGKSYVDKQIADSKKGPSQAGAEVATKSGISGFIAGIFKPSKLETQKTGGQTAGAVSGFRKCKGCTFVNGDNNKVAGDTKVKDGALSWEAAAANAGKKSQQATDSAVLQQAGGNTANIPGNGNTTTQTKQDTTEEAPGIGATLVKPLGIVLAVAAVGVLVYAFIWLLSILPRRKKETETV